MNAPALRSNGTRKGPEPRQPLVSVIIPAYNAERYLAGTVEAVLSQTYGPIELIVVDDGSTDGTAVLLASYAAQGRLRALSQRNAGPATARNRGIAAARGEYLHFLDADDLPLPDFLCEAVRFMEQYRHIDFVFTNYEVFDERGVAAPSGVDRWKIFRALPHFTLGEGQWFFAEHLAKHIIEQGGFMTTSAVTVRREAAVRAGGFREGFFYGEDDEFFARVTYRCRAGYIDRVLLRKRAHALSLIHDRSRALRNVAHFIALAELQRDYYRDDPAIQAVLERKIPSLLFDYCWHLIDRGRYREAQRLLLRALRRYRKAYPLYKLLLKSSLLNVYRAAPV